MSAKPEAAVQRLEASAPPRNRRNWYRDRQTLTVAEAAKILGIHRNTAQRMIAAGTLPSQKLAGRRLIAKATVDAILSGSEVRRG